LSAPTATVPPGVAVAPDLPDLLSAVKLKRGIVDCCGVIRLWLSAAPS